MNVRYIDIGRSVIVETRRAYSSEGARLVSNSGRGGGGPYDLMSGGAAMGVGCVFLRSVGLILALLVLAPFFLTLLLISTLPRKDDATSAVKNEAYAQAARSLDIEHGRTTKQSIASGSPLQ